MWQFFWTNMEYTVFKIYIVSSPWQSPQLRGWPRASPHRFHLSYAPQITPLITQQLADWWAWKSIERPWDHWKIKPCLFSRAVSAYFCTSSRWLCALPLDTMKSHCNGSINLHLQTKTCVLLLLLRGFGENEGWKQISLRNFNLLWFHLLIVNVVLLMTKFSLFFLFFFER